MTKIRGVCKVGDFSKVLKSELKTYTTAVEEGLSEVTIGLARQAAKDVNIASGQFNDTGSSQYDTGWKAKNESVRHRSRWVIHNKNAPGLAHLLEKGHAKTNGGRTSGKVHIAPIADKLAKDYEENVMAIIERGY